MSAAPQDKNVPKDGDGPLPIEDYALIGGCQTAALVGRNGSIDWLCWPFFDSDAYFAALLGSAENGRWSIAPAGGPAGSKRRYRGDTVVLETLFETDGGSDALIDFIQTEPDGFATVRRVESRHRLGDAQQTWPMQCRFSDHLRAICDKPDDGIWELRGERRQFTHSKVMAWVAVDSAVRDAEEFGLDAPLDGWRQLRDHMHQVICQQGFDPARNSFMQSFGDPAIDASLLLIPQVGFLPADDPRVIGTVKAVEEDLLVDGLVLWYRTDKGGDDLPPGEGAFLPCSFWLATAYQLQCRHAEARALFERLLALCNDIGLLAEEYDTAAKQQAGNFPQAYSHLALVGTALALDGMGMAQARRGA